MPLTTTGRKVLRKMQGRYGNEGGKRVFYASENSKPAFRRAVTRGGR